MPISINNIHLFIYIVFLQGTIIQYQFLCQRTCILQRRQILIIIKHKIIMIILDDTVYKNLCSIRHSVGIHFRYFRLMFFMIKQNSMQIPVQITVLRLGPILLIFVVNRHNPFTLSNNDAPARVIP